MLAPLLAGSVLRRKVPEVVLLLVLGVLIGPNVLDLAVNTDGVNVLRQLGLGMLFLLAGYEIEVHELVGRGGRRALVTWLASFALAAGVMACSGRRARSTPRWRWRSRSPPRRWARCCPSSRTAGCSAPPSATR